MFAETFEFKMICAINAFNVDITPCVFLLVPGFVGQTSEAATGAASIIVNDAGKCFASW